MGLSDRIVGEASQLDTVLKNEIDYGKVMDKLHFYRAESFRYIENSFRTYFEHNHKAEA